MESEDDCVDAFSFAQRVENMGGIYDLIVYAGNKELIFGLCFLFREQTSTGLPFGVFFHGDDRWIWAVLPRFSLKWELMKKVFPAHEDVFGGLGKGAQRGHEHRHSENGYERFGQTVAVLGETTAESGHRNKANHGLGYWAL